MVAGCYEFDLDFLPVRPTVYTSADLVIETIHIEPGDEFMAAPFPGDETIAERVERVCSPESEWF